MKPQLIRGGQQARGARPPSDGEDKRAAAEHILRYETSIERQFYRAMDQLERLQRRQRGRVGGAARQAADGPLPR